MVGDEGERDLAEILRQEPVRRGLVNLMPHRRVRVELPKRPPVFVNVDVYDR
jgi:hypothetical protein